MINKLWKQFLLIILSYIAKEAGEIIDFLQAENRILRGKINSQIKLTDYDRKILVKHGMPITDCLHEFISIVKPETLLKWNRQRKKEKWTYDNKPKNPGRPRKGTATEKILIKLAMENTWGYRRI